MSRQSVAIGVMGRVFRWVCAFLFGSVGAWGLEVSSSFLTLDGFKARPRSQPGELGFQGYGGYEVVLGTRDGLSRLDLRFGSRSVPLFRTGRAFGYDEESWLANKPLEWRGLKVGGVFEPVALIFRTWRARSGQARPVETYIVVSLEGCDSRVIGAFSVDDGPLEAVRHADRECVREDVPGLVMSSRRLVVERVVEEWLLAVRSSDEKRLRRVYSAGFARGSATRARGDDVMHRVASLGVAEAVSFSIKEEGRRLDVAFSLVRVPPDGGDSESLRVRLGMVREGDILKISSETLERRDSEKNEIGKGGGEHPSTMKVGESHDSGSALSRLMVGRWWASDGKGMMTLVFEDAGRFICKRLGVAGRGDPGFSGTWTVRNDLLVVDLGNGEEERKLTPSKGGRYKLEGPGGVLFIEKQR